MRLYIPQAENSKSSKTPTARSRSSLTRFRDLSEQEQLVANGFNPECAQLNALIASIDAAAPTAAGV
jgi:hypothetical protein